MKRNLSNIYNYTLKKKENILTTDELNKFYLFLEILNSSSCKIVLRRDNYNNLADCFNNTVINDPRKLGEYLFMIGDKAKMFWTEKKYIEINDTNFDNFKKICKSLLKYINEGCKGNNKDRIDRIKKFQSNNKDFCAFLENIETDDEIKAKYENLCKADKIIINSYYLSIAHTINALKYKTISNYVSTTEESESVEKFEGDITIYAWHSKNYAVSEETTTCVSQLGFVTCTPVYPEQNEISFKYGILPHFIIGFENKIDNSFYVNPAVFNAMDEINQKQTLFDKNEYEKIILKNGLIINQTFFKDFLKETNLTRHFETDGVQFNIIAY